jgi:hypothetical protein
MLDQEFSVAPFNVRSQVPRKNRVPTCAIGWFGAAIRVFSAAISERNIAVNKGFDLRSKCVIGSAIAGEIEKE